MTQDQLALLNFFAAVATAVGTIVLAFITWRYTAITQEMAKNMFYDFELRCTPCLEGRSLQIKSDTWENFEIHHEVVNSGEKAFTIEKAFVELSQPSSTEKIKIEIPAAATTLPTVV